MQKTARLFNFANVYPIIIILVIPLLLVANTFWNLRSFNRDANFIVRHQAISIAEVLKTQVESGGEDVTNLLSKVESESEDILSISLLSQANGNFEVEASTLLLEDATRLKDSQLSHLALGFDEPVAALTYDPKLRRNVWNVVVPMSSSDGMRILNFQLDTKSVTEILARTSNDSFIILSILVVFTLILLANHFYFYLRALRTKQLEEIDRLKDEFISMAAHELRAPITAITGYLDLLKDKLANVVGANAGEEIDVLSGLTKDLNGLVEDLLDVSRIEQGRIKVTLTDTNVIEVIDKVITVMTPMTSQKGLSLTFEKLNLPLVKTDPERLRQVITNLVSNSVKYTLKGGITVSAKEEGGFLKVTVKDTGVGIPPEHMSKLFGKFHRVQDKLTTEVRGTGLGLWITKQLIEIMGGKIYVESIYGSGSSFSFTLPISRVG